MFDTTPVKAEAAAVQAVMDEYRLPLENGVIDPDENLPKFRQALKDAGIDTVIAEKQRQLDEWAATKYVKFLGKVRGITQLTFLFKGAWYV